MSDFTLRMPRLGESRGLGQNVLTGRLHLDPELEGLCPVCFYLPPLTPDSPPILNITGALTQLADPTKPSFRLGGPVPLVPQRSGPPWKVPSPASRAGKTSDLTAAVMGIPQVKKAVTQVEGMAKAELGRLWKEIKSDKASWPVVGPWVLTAGFMAFKALDQTNPTLKIDQTVRLDKLPEKIRLPVPGLSVQFKYQGDFRTLVRDPAQGKELAGAVKLDLAELVRALK